MFQNHDVSLGVVGGEFYLNKILICDKHICTLYFNSFLQTS